MTRAEKASALGLQSGDCPMGMFDYTVRFIVGDYDKAVEFVAWNYEMPVELVEVKQDAPKGKCFRRPGWVPIIWVPRRPRGSHEQATLAHECLHAVFYLFDWMNSPVDFSTEELAAHSMAHIINSFYEQIK